MTSPLYSSIRANNYNNSILRNNSSQVMPLAISTRLGTGLGGIKLNEDGFRSMRLNEDG